MKRDRFCVRDCVVRERIHAVFLVADMQLYKRLCPSVRWSVGWLVCGHESQSEEMSVLEHF